MVNITSKADL